jgi:hypothetical protein
MTETSHKLRVIPVTLEAANDFVRRLHRHSRPVTGSKFAIGAQDACRRCEETGRIFEMMVGQSEPCPNCKGEKERLVGVAIVGRPVAPRLDDGLTAEITRVCTDGTRNACSLLYGACRKAARALGYTRIFTYTLPEEGGSSLRAAGFRLDKENAGGPAKAWHNRPGRTAEPVGTDLVGGKWRWAA